MSSDPARDPNDPAAKQEERVRSRSNREIDADADALPPATDESNANNRQQSPQTDSITDFEIPISTLPPPKSPPPPSSISVSEPDPDPTRATHSPQLDHGSLTISATAGSTAAVNPSSSRLDSGQVVEESNDGFRTPTNTIPLTTECPPAPRKPKSRRRRTVSALLSQEEIESLRYDLAVEVDMWLEILEEEDRKRRMKIARREAGRL